MGLSLAKDSGLILSNRVGEHADMFIGELVFCTEGRTRNTAAQKAKLSVKLGT